MNQPYNISSPLRLVRFSVLVIAFQLVGACGSSGSNNSPQDDSVENGLTEAQMIVLPDDCLITTDTILTAYCFSPQDRTLMAVFPDGAIYWHYALPGDNNSNYLEGIEVVNNTLILIADITADVGQSKYEISRFELGGAFIDTLPILEPFTRLRGDHASNSPALNLDEEDIIVVANEDALFVSAVVFELIPNGDRLVRADWSIAGSSITRIAPEDGNRQAYRMIPNSRLSALEISGNELVTISTDGFEQRFMSSNLSAVNTSANENLTNPDSISTLLPYLYQQLQADYLSALRTDVMVIIDDLAIPIEAAEPDCIYENPDIPSRCFGEITTGPVQHDCSISGSVTETRYASRSFIGGQGSTTEDIRTYYFDSCQQMIPAQTGLIEGEYELTGTLVMKDRDGDIRQGHRRTTSADFTDLVLTDPGASSTWTTSSQTDTVTGTSFGLVEKDVSIDIYKRQSLDVRQEVTVTNLVFHSEMENPSEPARRVSIFGSMQISSDTTSDKNMQMSIDPPLNNLYYETDPVTLSGSIQIDADDGSSVSIQAMENPDFPGDEQLQYNLIESGEMISVTKPFESLLIPIF